MRRTILLLAALALGLALIWRLRSDDEPPQVLAPPAVAHEVASEGLAADTPSANVAAGPREGAAGASEAADGVAVEPPPPWSVTGTVVTLAGAPVSDVRIEGIDLEPRPSALTDAVGDFVLEVPGDRPSVAVTVVDEAWAALSWSRVERADATGVTLHVAPVCVIDGTIVHASGAAVESGTVSLMLPDDLAAVLPERRRVGQRPAPVSAGGRFELTDVPQLDGSALYFSSPEGSGTLDLADLPLRGIRWVLPERETDEPVELRGRVVDSAGRGVEGARVVLHRLETRSGPDGAFELAVPDDVPRDAALVAWREGFGAGTGAPPWAELVTASETERTSVRVELRALVPVRGRLLWPDDRPVADAQVELTDGVTHVGHSVPRPTLQAMASGLRLVRTDADGAFTMHLLEGQEASVRATVSAALLWAPCGTLRAVEELQILRVPAEHVPAPLTVRVVDAEGTAMPGVEVRLRRVVDRGEPVSQHLTRRPPNRRRRSLHVRSRGP